MFVVASEPAGVGITIQPNTALVYGQVDLFLSADVDEPVTMLGADVSWVGDGPPPVTVATDVLTPGRPFAVGVTGEGSLSEDPELQELLPYVVSLDGYVLGARRDEQSPPASLLLTLRSESTGQWQSEEITLRYATSSGAEVQQVIDHDLTVCAVASDNPHGGACG